MGKLISWFDSRTLSICVVISLASWASAAAASEQSLRAEIDALNNRVDQLSKVANSPDSADSKWHLSGYMDAGLVVTNSNTEEDRFVSGHFNPGFHFQHSDKVFFEAELEIETEGDGATNIAIEYSAINVILNDNATLVIGKWLSPVGQFQERLHPTWINRMATAPVGFGHGGIQPLSDVGVQLRGAVPVGKRYFTYVVAVGNGPQGGHHGAELEGFSEDDNSDKSFAGRLGFFPLDNLEVGVSLLTAGIRGEEADTGPITDGDFDLFGADFAYTPAGALEIRGEYLDAELGSFFGREHHGDTTTSLIDPTDWKAWYLQAAYRIPDSRLEPVIRFGDLEVEGHFAGEGESRVDVGINYWVAPSAAFRLGYQRRSFDEPGEEDESLVQFQFAYGF